MRFSVLIVIVGATILVGLAAPAALGADFPQRTFPLEIPLRESPEQCGGITDLTRRCLAQQSGACTLLASAYAHGRGVRPQRRLAANLAAHDCAQGVGKGCRALGLWLAWGWAGSMDDAWSRAMLQRACDARVGLACVDLAKSRLRDKFECFGPESARPLYERACTLGSARGCLERGLLAARGQGEPVDTAIALPFIRQSCEADHPDGCYWLAYFYERGIEMEPDLPRARALFTHACERGSALACERLYAPLMTHPDKPWRQDKDAARRFWERGCRANRWMACHGLLAEGNLPPRRAAAVRQRLCELGHGESCMALAAQRFQSLQGLTSPSTTAPGGEPPEVTATKREGFDYVYAACQAKIGDACAELARRHRRGWDLPADGALARYFAARACRFGVKSECGS